MDPCLLYRNNCSKQFGKRLHRLLVTLRGGEQCAMRMCRYVTIGRCPPAHVPLKIALLVEELDAHGPLDLLESALPPKGHLDRFSRFCTAHLCTQQTHKQTHRHADHATCDICSNGLHACTVCRRRGIKTKKIITQIAYYNNGVFNTA